MEFKIIGEYVKQQERNTSVLEEIGRSRDQAREELHALKTEYERLAAAMFASGVGADSELDTLSDRIDAAERTLARRNREYEFVVGRQSTKITIEDIIASWNQDFIPEFRAKVYDPAIQALLDAKLAYIDAFRRYRDAVKQHEGIKRGALQVLGGESASGGSRYRYSLKNVDFETIPEAGKYKITAADLYDLSRDKSPRSVQYVKRG
ncbi:hypothetical protein [Cohnella phaseoli]|uniref:Uncharacterized protein n=1 Tax=Cohnella phaseoli TaxID=456490 RepID=A0A3D9KKU4_9BACL|nr:hypothetical protein [Cohnella phaseoli]RED86203.1 hypothetical protein DFP98_10354 [Cohnella phaseoli]